MTVDLVTSDDPILRQETPAFDFAHPPTDPIELAHTLYQTMVHNKALGLSAPQIGLPYRAFALSAVPGIVCFNPRIIDESNETILLDEGCATYPHLFLKVKRPRRIKVRYTEPNGNIVTKVLDGMTARAFMHEMDHLNGVAFTSKANPIHLERAMRKKKELDRLVKKATERGII